MKNIILVFIFTTFYLNSFSQGCVEFIDRDMGSIMGFTDCEFINDSTCIPIEGENGLLLYGYGGQSEHLWVYEYNIKEKIFNMPDNVTVTIEDTSQIVMPNYPKIRDYCGDIKADTDTLVCYVMESRLVPLEPPAPGVKNVELIWEKKWTFKNDRDYMQPDTIKINKKFEIGEVTYTFIYEDCLNDRHEWKYTYVFEEYINRKPIIYHQ